MIKSPNIGDFFMKLDADKLYEEYVEDVVLSETKPITYAYYLESIKPKSEVGQTRKVVYAFNSYDRLRKLLF